jgi:membrane protein required for colicin V production
MNSAISWVDLLLLAMLAASVLLGLWRGLVFELLSIAGWVVAYLGAPYLAPTLQAWLPQERLGPSALHVAGLVLAFILILLAWGLAAKLLRALIHASPLSVLDRLAGGGFGVLRAALLAVLMVVVVNMTPIAATDAWQASQGVPHLQQLLLGLRPLLPVDISKMIPA